MNEKARIDRPIDEQTTSDETTLFGQVADTQNELDDFLSDEPQADAQRPRLTLCRPEEFEELDTAASDDIDDRKVYEKDVEPASDTNLDNAKQEIDNWPWDHDLAELRNRSEATEDYDDLDFEELDRLTRPSASQVDTPRHAAVEDDHSAIEDVVLSMPIVQTPIEETLAGFARQMEAASSDSDTEAKQPIETDEGESQSSAAPVEEMDTADGSLQAAASVRHTAPPKRIGSGQLVPARLTWRPGDPFGDSGGAHRRRFRWDIMLTSAGITAACGMACIWLLRTILA